jgi:hypothetical protein
MKVPVKFGGSGLHAFYTSWNPCNFSQHLYTYKNCGMVCAKLYYQIPHALK